HRAFSVVVRLGARLDLNGVLQDAISAEFGLSLLARFGVSGMAKVVGDLPGIGLLAYSDAAWLRVYLGSIGKDRSAHPLIDDFLVLDVVVGKDAKEDQANDQACRHGGTHNGALQSCMRAFDARDFKFYGQAKNSGGFATNFLRRMAGQSVTCWC